MAGGNFVHRVVSYVVNELIVERLSNSLSFQRFAVKSAKRMEDIATMAARKRQEIAEQVKELSKDIGSKTS